MKKNSDFYNQLCKEYKAKIAMNNNLTNEQLEEIVAEGLNKEWPFPQYEE